MTPTAPTSAPRASAIALGMALALAASASAAQRVIRDRVYLKGSDEPQVVTVTGESIDGIKTDRGVDFPIEGVVRIEYGDAPYAFNDGEQHRVQGRYEEAIRLYEAAMRSQTPRQWWLQPACRYHIALCRLEQGSKESLRDAEKGFQDLIKEFPNTRWLPHALLGLGRVQFEMGTKTSYEEALQRSARLGELAARKGWEGWQFRAGLWQSRCLRKLERYDDALQRIERVLRAATDPKHQDIRIEAQVEKAMLLMAQGKYRDAIEDLRRLIDEIASAVAEELRGTDTRLQRVESRCFNTLGQCYLAMGNQARDDKDKERNYREALLSFLWTVVLYQRLPAEHAEALFHAAQCFEKLGQRSRADELRNDLRERYPDSPYTRQLPGNR